MSGKLRRVTKDSTWVTEVLSHIAAPCIDSSPAGTVYRREDGLVIIDPEKAKEHPEIVDTCPYGAIYWNEETRLPQKCTGCAHLIDAGWTETRCSQVCPTGALKLVLADDGAMAARAKADGLHPYLPELGTKPRVWYKNLHRWTTSFIGGTAVYQDTDDCAEGATVVLSSGGTAVAETSTNNYGDFAIDRLEPGKYDLAITAAGYKAVSRMVVLETSTNLGVLFLQK